MGQQRLEGGNGIVFSQPAPERIFLTAHVGLLPVTGAPSKRHPCRMTAKIAIRAIFPSDMSAAVRKIASPPLTSYKNKIPSHPLPLLFSP